jgi:predicted transposase YdaD
MIKNGSPLIRELYREAIREGRREGHREGRESTILEVLTGRFGAGAEALQPELGAISDARLKDFAVLAATCPDLASFREHLRPRKRKAGQKG